MFGYGPPFNPNDYKKPTEPKAVGLEADSTETWSALDALRADHDEDEAIRRHGFDRVVRYFAERAWLRALRLAVLDMRLRSGRN